MKITVCKGCGHSMETTNMKTGKPNCVICIGLELENSIPVEIEMPDEIKCGSCGKISKVSDLLKHWRDIPFYNSKEESYYCGCQGWE